MTEIKIAVYLVAAFAMWHTAKRMIDAKKRLDAVGKRLAELENQP